MFRAGVQGQVPRARTKDAGIGTGGFWEKDCQTQSDWTLWMRNFIHIIISCFSNSGYLPAWSSGFALSRTPLLLMKLPADVGQKNSLKKQFLGAALPWISQEEETQRNFQVEEHGEIVMSALGLTCFQAFGLVILKKFVTDIVLCSAESPAEV